MKTEFLPLDPLGEALNLLRLSETTYYHSELTAPWALAMPENLKFHFVTSGRCWLEVQGAEHRLLEPGDLAVVLDGKGHRLSSDPSARAVRPSTIPCQRISKRYALLKYGGGGALTTTICGDLNFNHPEASHLIAHLPKIIHVQSVGNYSMEWIYSTVRFMAVEARDIRPGGEAIITRLADILVIQAIRSWIAQNPQAQTGWLTALQDKRISVAIALIHEQPEKEWTVDALAHAAAMSRSAFSARFAELVGEPVMRYVTRWRMHLASIHLRDGNQTIDEIAGKLGYGSGPAFSRAVKRFYGMWPGALRLSLAKGRQFRGDIQANGAS